MTTTATRKLFVTGAVGAAISAATTALLFLGVGTAQAVVTIDNLPTPRTCGGCIGFNPQPDPPAFPERRSKRWQREPQRSSRQPGWTRRSRYSSAAT